MCSMGNFRWLWLYFLFGQFYIQYVSAAWPVSTSSKIQLLGIFSNKLNITGPASQPLHYRAMFTAALLLAQQYNIKIDGQYIGWRLVDNGGDVMNTLDSTCQLVSTSNIVGIVGPTFSRESHIIAPFAEKLGIPVISHSSTDPELSDRNVYPTFYRTISSDNATALVIAKLFMKFNWTSCIIIYQNDAFGTSGAKVISETFNKDNITVSEMIVFDIKTHTIRGGLKHLLTSSSIRIIILWAEQSHASFILQNALEADVVGPVFTWILSDNVQLNSFKSIWYPKLIGILIVQSVVGDVVSAPINRTLLNAAYDLWQKYEPESFPGSDNVNYEALFAFDAAWSLIQSLQRLCSTITNRSSSCISITNSSSCFSRNFINSTSLLNVINHNAFLGVSGPVEFSTNTTDRINGIYYVLNNVQDSLNGLNYVPVLIRSDSSDWTSHKQGNTIIWPGKSLTPPTGYAAIEGVTLRIAIIEAAPFTMTKEIKDANGTTTTKQVGYIPDLIEHLQKKMRFIPNIIYLPSNQTYNGLVDAVARNDYDMIVGDVTILAERKKKVDFSAAIFHNSLRIIIRDKPTPKVDYFAHLRPFSWSLWLVIAGALICSFILLYLFERKDGDRWSWRTSTLGIGTSIYNSFEAILGFSSIRIKTFSGRLLAIAIFILSVVLIAGYTADLASYITLLRSDDLISGIDDIKNGRLPYSRVGILVDSSIEDFYLREISSGSRNFYPLKSKEDMYNKLLVNVIDAAIMDAGVLEYTTSGVYCNLSLVGKPFDYSEFGIVFQKKWLYAQILDFTLLSLRESGIFNDLKSKWFQTSYCSRPETPSTQFSAESMAGLFLTFGAVAFVAILVRLLQLRMKFCRRPII